MFIQQTFIHNANASPKESVLSIASISQNALDYIQANPARQLIVPNGDGTFQLRMYLSGTTVLAGSFNSSIDIYIDENTTDASQISLNDLTFYGYEEEDHLIMKAMIDDVCTDVPQALS